MPDQTGPGSNRLIPGEDLLPHLRKFYRLHADHCELIRHGFNDTYRVTAGPDQYILRVYLNAKYYISGPEDFRFELEWLTYLSEAGIPVAAPLRALDGELLCELAAGSAVRWSALFPFAPGEPLKAPNAEQSEQLGHVVGRLHRVSDGFISTYHRYNLDLSVLIDRPIELITALARERGFGGIGSFLSAISSLREQVNALPTRPGSWGLIHGDLNRGNHHYQPDHGFTLIDFDHSGRGWRAYDLAAVKNSMEGETWASFLAGYRREFELAEAHLEAVSLMQRVRRVWDIGDVLGMMPAWNDQPDENLCQSVQELLTSL